jgi:hypothetical protein
MHQEICDFGRALIARVNKQRVDAFIGGLFTGTVLGLLLGLL